jgi:hypothetical protein
MQLKHAIVQVNATKCGKLTFKHKIETVIDATIWAFCHYKLYCHTSGLFWALWHFGLFTNFLLLVDKYHFLFMLFMES